MSVNGMKTHEKNVRMYRPCESVSGNICIPYVDDNLVITYNFLNLPKEIKKSGTVVSKYAYLSDGKKVSSCDADGNGYMYFGTARFTLDNNVPTFESIPFSGGRIVKTTNGYEPQYYLTDHLGSTRMIVNKDGKTVEATFDYTPFGVQITGASLPTNSTEYRFSGKEMQNISDYEIYDFGARQYFPKYAIWSSADPLSETYYPITPYAYCVNNPIRYIDPDGRKIVVNDIVDNELIKYEWRQYDENWGFYDKNHNLYNGDNEYISNLSTALSQLMNGGETGYALVSNVAGADEIIKIGLGRGGKNAYYSKKSESGGDISWNPRSTSTIPTENGSKSNIPFISLGHELAHAWDDILGTMNSGKWFPGAKYMEIYATHMENLIRKENHLPLRTHYATDGYGYGSGPRIIDLSGRSIFYNINGVTTYNRVSPQERFVY